MRNIICYYKVWQERELRPELPSMAEEKFNAIEKLLAVSLTVTLLAIHGVFRIKH